MRISDWSSDVCSSDLLLRLRGYRTALIGKSHLQNMLDAPPFVVREQIDEGKWQPPIYAREAVKPALGDDYGQELPSRWRSSEQYLVKTPYYGFEEIGRAHV